MLFVLTEGELGLKILEFWITLRVSSQTVVEETDE